MHKFGGLKRVLGVDKIPVDGLHHVLAPKHHVVVAALVRKKVAVAVLGQLVERRLGPANHERVSRRHAVRIGVLGHLVGVGNRFRWQQDVHVHQIVHCTVKKSVAIGRFSGFLDNRLNCCRGRAVAAGGQQSLVQKKVWLGHGRGVSIGNGLLDVQVVEFGERVETYLLIGCLGLEVVECGLLIGLLGCEGVEVVVGFGGSPRVWLLSGRLLGCREQIRKARF